MERGLGILGGILVVAVVVVAMASGAASESLSPKQIATSRAVLDALGVKHAVCLGLGPHGGPSYAYVYTAFSCHPAGNPTPIIWVSSAGKKPCISRTNIQDAVDSCLGIAKPAPLAQPSVMNARLATRAALVSFFKDTHFSATITCKGTYHGYACRWRSKRGYGKATVTFKPPAAPKVVLGPYKRA